MMVPLRTPSIDEHWDCHGCGVCCRATLVELNADDLQRLHLQHWERRPEFRGRKFLMRWGLWRPTYFLARGKDGCCPFFTDEGLCLIHKEYGLSAKPLFCQMFPLQLVPLGEFAHLTTRRFCPSAASEKGRELKEHLDEGRRMADQGQLAASAGAPPPIVRRQTTDWPRTLLTAARLERMMRDERYPLVRRLTHALAVCDHLDRCQFTKLSQEQLGSLLDMLENAAVREAAPLFAERRPPRRAPALLFRQIVLEYARLHPKFLIERSWTERWHLVRAALAFTRGRGPLPPMHECYPPTTFEELDRPLGVLASEVLQPLVAYFEANAASLYYALPGRAGWSLVDSFRAMALSYPVALWLLRLRCGDRMPEPDDMIDIVGAIDRGRTCASLLGRRHRRRVRSLARLRSLGALAVWYGR